MRRRTVQPAHHLCFFFGEADLCKYRFRCFLVCVAAKPFLFGHSLLGEADHYTSRRSLFGASCLDPCAISVGRMRGVIGVKKGQLVALYTKKRHLGKYRCLEAHFFREKRMVAMRAALRADPDPVVLDGMLDFALTSRDALLPLRDHFAKRQRQPLLPWIPGCYTTATSSWPVSEALRQSPSAIMLPCSPR